MHENRILKNKEARFNEEYNTLEEENTSLQKNLSRAKQTMVEFEGLKVENQSLLDEIDSLRLQLQMASSARDQFEKQLHESLESLKEQREKITHNQREINELKQQAIAQKCGMVYGKGDFNGRIDMDGGGEHPLVRQIEQEYKTTHPSPSPAVVDDILKELQGGEVRDLEEQLRVVQEEKEHLEKELTRQASNADIVADATSLLRRGSSGNVSEEGDEYTLNNQLQELSDVRSRESAYQLEIKRLCEETDELKELLVDVENEKNALEESAKGESKQLSDDLLQTKSKLRESEGKVKDLKERVSVLKETASEGDGLFKNLYDGLVEILNQLLSVQCKVVIINGEEQTDSKIAKPGEMSSPSDCLKLTTQVKRQVQTLNVAVEKTMNKQKTSSAKEGDTNGEQNNDIIAENALLKEQILKLKSLVTTKREQISTLRTVLKANKSTYEVALANLKSRYENDKQIQSEANGQLKKQIKSLKSECQTFASLRSMFASRCEEYLKELHEKQKAILAAEEEKRTLNQLLKQAIHQKVALTQRVEEFEIARERLRQFTKKNAKSVPSGASATGATGPANGAGPKGPNKGQRPGNGPRGPPRPVTRL
eukprot:TCONS_00062732-protein